MKRKLVFLYSGQGSQYYQMGRKIFENDIGYRAEMLRLDEIIKEIFGYSVLDELFQDGKKKTDVFDELKYTHPAIFMSQVAVTKALMGRGIEPDYFMGSSLGEIVAVSMATGNIDEIFINIVSQVQNFECCKNGGMMAVFDKVENYDAAPEIYENSIISAVNYDSMYVISGKNEGLLKVEEYFKKKQVIYQRLPVNYAFHSQYVDAARENILCQENLFQLNPIKIPVISCCMEEPILREIEKGYFWNIIRNPIQFMRSIQWVAKQDEEYLFADLSLTGSQANYIRRIVKDAKMETYSPFTLFQCCNDLDKVADWIKN